jgi:hypothetical protein
MRVKCKLTVFCSRQWRRIPFSQADEGLTQNTKFSTAVISGSVKMTDFGILDTLETTFHYPFEENSTNLAVGADRHFLAQILTM